MLGSVTMHIHSEFECEVLIAAENARRDGYTHTYLAMLDIVRALRHRPNGEPVDLKIKAGSSEH